MKRAIRWIYTGITEAVPHSIVSPERSASTTKLRNTILAVCLSWLLVPQLASAHDFLGDLVYCDVDADGLFDPADGDYGLDGIDVDIICTADDGTECINLTTTTGALHSSVFRMEGMRPVLAQFPDHCPVAWDPFGDLTGRYLIELSDSCAPLPKPWTCTVAVDPSTLPTDCAALVTPMTGGPPFDDGDGKYCDKITDGPFPEGETLGNIHYAYEEATCLMFPDPAPGDGRFTVIIFPDNGGGQLSDFCAAYNDFGYTLGEECGNDIREGDEQCDGLDLGDCFGDCLPDCTCAPVCGDGIINQPEEECEPPNREICNNNIDDDGDMLIDCDDEDCPVVCDVRIACETDGDCPLSEASGPPIGPLPAATCHDGVCRIHCANNVFCAGISSGAQCVGAQTCDENCKLVENCQKLGRDPASIRFDRGAAGLDLFKMHASFFPRSQLDPVSDGFSVLLTNAEGVVYRASLLAGDMVSRRNGKRFAFSDRSAKQGNGVRDGLARIRLKLRMRNGVPNYSFSIKAWGDFSSATLPMMRTQIVIGNDGTSGQAEWRPTRFGWKALSSDFF